MFTLEFQNFPLSKLGNQAIESNNDSQTTQYPQSNSYQNESGMESKNSSSGILNKYLTSDDFKFQYGIESKFICEFCYQKFTEKKGGKRYMLKDCLMDI